MMSHFTFTIKGTLTGMLISLVFWTSVQYFKLPYNGNIQYAVWMIYLGGIFWSLKAVQQKNPSAPFRQYFSEGFKTFIIVTLIASINMYFFHKLNPQILEAFVADNNQKIIQTHSKTTAEIAENEQTIRKIFLPMMLSVTVIIYLALGALITTVIGGFLSTRATQKHKLA